MDLPVADLSSAEGKLMLQMFSAFAEFERNRIRERTREGIERAKAQGKSLGDRKLIKRLQPFKLKKQLVNLKPKWLKNWDLE